MQHPRVSVVILNWNGKTFLQQFLPRVMDHLPAWATVVVADNASTDHSIQYVKQVFPEIRTIELHENLGYAGGYNTALKQIAADYYILLNSDIEVAAGWIEPVINLMEGNPKIAACQPKILSYNQPAFFEYAGASGGYIDKYGYPFCRGRMFQTLEKDDGQYDDSRQVFWASGACLFVRADIFHKLGGFDERFFAHMEEIDLCWRMNNAGYEVMVCPTSVVFHVGGGTLPKSNPHKTFLNFRNNLWMLAKNMPTGTLVKTLIVRIFLDKMAACKFLASGHPGECMAVFKAYAAFIKHYTIMRTTAGNAPKMVPEMMWKKGLLWQYYVKGRKKFSELP
jgi:GT2 family glycosyltransferase